MSLYQHLGVPVPVIAYCIAHQAAAQVAREEYLATIAEFHRMLAEENRGVAESYARSLREGTDRGVQLLRSGLAQFLETPVRSDAEEVRRTLSDALERITGKLMESRFPGLQYSLEGRTLFPASRQAVERRLLQQGRSHLEGLGFEVTRADPPVHESLFVVSGGGGLDLLEHLVRDRLGIYDDAHGRHLGRFRRTSYAAYNLVHAAGAMPPPERIPVCVEAALSFAKPDLPYDGVRDALLPLAAGLAHEVNPEYVSLWQRKLGLGAGMEFVLRVIGSSAEIIGGSVQWLGGQKMDPPVRRALLLDGKLLVKELLLST